MHYKWPENLEIPGVSVTMACIFHYAQVSHCKGAPTQAKQILMHYLFYAFYSNAFCRTQL